MTALLSWLETPWFWLGSALLLLALSSIRKRRWGLALIGCSLFVHLLWQSVGWNLLLPHFLPPAEHQTSRPIWIRGLIQSYQVGSDSSQLILRSVSLLNANGEASLLQISLTYPHFGSRVPRWYHGRPVQLGGTVDLWEWRAPRWHARFQSALLEDSSPPRNFWQTKLDWLRFQWQTRAAFYLSRESLALYLPLTLAERSVYHPSIQLFRQTGMAHVLAISGLHIGLLYLSLALLWRGIGQVQPTLWERPRFRVSQQWGPILFLWGYVVLLEFPIPALRAVTMISLWFWFESLGLRLPALFSLLTTALLFLVWDWSTIYSLSFQLSFVAVAFLIGLGELFPMQISGWRRWLIESLRITAFVSMGTLPLLLHSFGRFSLEVFWLNLLLVPLLAVWILPTCLFSLFWSGWFLGSPPEAWGERMVFEWVDFSLQAWLGLLRWLQLPEGRFELQSSWEGWQFVLYYGVLGGGLFVWKKFPCSKRRFTPDIRTH